MQEKPIIGILLGDAAGVGPELVAKVLLKESYQTCCRPVIIGDVRIFERGLQIMKHDYPHYVIDDISQADWSRGIPVLDQHDQAPELAPLKVSSAYCGKAIINMIKTAVALVQENKIDGFIFAPLNKASMKLAGLKFESEDYLMADLFGVTGPFGEISVLDNLLTTRVTSHIPLKDVSSKLSVTSILRAVELLNSTLHRVGIPNPKIGVAAINPHAGENGQCGTEEIDVIAPAVEEGRSKGYNLSGPYAADTLFGRAFKGEFDGVVTMYHDEGQIALKVKGFERGVTISGGQPAPVVTCSHGSAYDIAGTGIAKETSLENALLLAAKMAAEAKKLQAAKETV